MFSFAATRPRRKPSLTPMIDVVFLLLVFFMLAARFGHDTALPLAIAGGDGVYSGPPRLIDVTPELTRLNGTPHVPDNLSSAVQSLMTKPDDIILIRARDGASLQRIVDVIERLRHDGLPNLVLVE